MIKANDSNVALKLFHNGAESIPLPFELTINNELYLCTDIFRLLPGKRLVVKAQDTSGQQLVIKLFVKQNKGERELIREERGYQCAKQAGVNVPSLIFSSNSDADYCAVAYQYLENAQLFTNTEEELETHSDSLLKIASALHCEGIVHNDFHLGNILIVGSKLYLIDLASLTSNESGRPLSKHISLSNLAVLIAQFNFNQQQTLIERLQQYYLARGWQFKANEKEIIDAYVDKAWQKRKVDYMKKGLRNCTLTVYQKNFFQQYGFQRSFFEEVGEEFLQDINDLVLKGQILKAGSTATVVKVNYAGKTLVIKRYNIKSFWHLLRRCCRSSRAAISWQNGRLLQLLGVATPMPLGFIENRIGWFRSTAYLVCEQSDGQDMKVAFKKRVPTQNELIQLENIFKIFKKYHISHGDFKATNFLIEKNGTIQLIDLDAMREHRNKGKFQRHFAKDKRRFIANWENSDIQAAITSISI
jgi:tRNA A-37 threonylcarbamoyl transferase component Bud32